MDENFTNNAEAVYLASLTQEKKILFLERQLANSEMYTKNLEQDLEATKLTINRLIKQRTNNEVLAKMSQNVYRMERRHQEVQQMLRQNNAKLLIEMQLRIQQKLEYTQKTRELQEQIDLIRKTNKDKQQEFAIIVNKLRKYEDIRQLMIQKKISAEEKKELAIREEDKDKMIQQIAEQLGKYKAIHQEYHQDLDRKIGIFAYALENKVNYEDLKEQFNYMIREQTRANELEKVVQEKIMRNAPLEESMKRKQQIEFFRETKGELNLNESTKQLIKQLKKLVIANKLLEAALNDSIEKNKQLIINQKIVGEANRTMRKQLEEYRNKQARIRKMGLVRSSSRCKIMGQFQKEVRQAQPRGLKRSQTFQYQKQLSANQYQDDFTLNVQKEQVPELAKQKKLKQYLQTLKSKDYQVNIENLCNDVRRMGEFLILCLGNRSKEAPYLKYNNINTTYHIKKPNSFQEQELKSNDRNTYLKIKERKEKIKKIKNSRSLSFDFKDERDQKDLDLKQEKEKQITHLPIESNFIRKGIKIIQKSNKNVVTSRTQGQRDGSCRKFMVREEKKQLKNETIKKIQLLQKNPYILSFGRRSNNQQINNGELDQLQNHQGDTSLKIEEF